MKNQITSGGIFLTHTVLAVTVQTTDVSQRFRRGTCES